MVGLGTLVNVAGIVIGGIIGCFCGKLLNEKQQESMNKACGLCVIFISIAGAMEGMLSIANNDIVSGKAMFITLSMAFGTLLGEIIDIEAMIERFGEWLKTYSGSSEDGNFAEAFANASFTVCIGAMAIVGAIQDGLTGNPMMLWVKTILDFVIIAVMASSMGKGCIFSAIPVLLLEGSITLLAHSISAFMTSSMIDAISLVGSLLIFCVGVNLVWGKVFRVANMLPAIVLATIIIPFVK